MEGVRGLLRGSRDRERGPGLRGVGVRWQWLTAREAKEARRGARTRGEHIRRAGKESRGAEHARMAVVEIASSSLLPLTSKTEGSSGF